MASTDIILSPGPSPGSCSVNPSTGKFLLPSISSIAFLVFHYESVFYLFLCIITLTRDAKRIKMRQWKQDGERDRKSEHVKNDLTNAKKD